MGGSLTPRQHTAVARVNEQAQRLCDLVDAASQTVPGDLLGQLLIRLTELERAVRRLPVVAGDPSRAPARDRGWRAVADNIHRALGADDLYWRPGELATADSATLVAASLGDDLADIDRELRRGLRLFAAGDAEGAAHVWRDGFERRWGRHLDGTLAPLTERSLPAPPTAP